MYLWCLKMCFDREIATESARSCPVPAALSGGDPRVPAQHRHRVPSVTGCRLPGLLAEALRVSLPPAGQRGGRYRALIAAGGGPEPGRQSHDSPQNDKKNGERRLPPLPQHLYSQPEVEHGAGVHQQRPEERRRERVRRGRTPHPPHAPPLPRRHPGPGSRYPQSSRSPIMAAETAAETERAGQGHGEGEAAPAPSPFPPRCPRSLPAGPEAPGAETPRARAPAAR